MPFRAVESLHLAAAGHCAFTYLGYPVGLLRGKLGSGTQLVRGSVMKCEVPHQQVIFVNQVGFGYWLEAKWPFKPR